MMAVTTHYAAGLGWTTTDINVYAHNGNYSALPVDTSINAGLLSRPDLKLSFTWAGTHCLFMHGLYPRAGLVPGATAKHARSLPLIDVALLTGGKCIKSPYTQTTPPYCNGPDQFWDKLLVVRSPAACYSLAVRPAPVTQPLIASDAGECDDWRSEGSALPSVERHSLADYYVVHSR